MVTLIDIDFNQDDEDSWMAKYFFAGGTMPSQDLFMWFQEKVQVVDRWVVNGKHYGQTSEEWLKLMDKNKDRIMEIFKDCYKEDYKVWFQRWRMFYLGVAETFNYNNGEEWFVVHYLLKRK
jgi:cyclopropane fatty-acyl-phospholipid synthase-like methyltransferase